MKYLFSFFIIACSFTAICAQTVKYSTAWFGPNANPVPEFTDARIPTKTTISLMGDYYFGYGDQTKNGYVKVEIPLVSERVSLKIWSTVLEHYNTTEEIMQLRGSTATSGSENGDLYVQTRISLFSEQKKPSIHYIQQHIKNCCCQNIQNPQVFRHTGLLFRFGSR